MFQSRIDRISQHFCCCFFILSGALIHSDKDMRTPPQASISIHLLLRFTIKSACLSLNISVRDHRWAYLLIPIIQKLLFKRLQCIKMRIHCSLHLELIIDKEVKIFIHTLFIYYPVRVILIIGILKFRTTHWSPIDCHDSRVRLPISHCCGEQCD